MQLRVKLAIAAFAGVGAAWLFPHLGSDEAPDSSLSPTPSDRPGVTAETAPLDTIPEGVSFRVIDGVRVFLARTGTRIIAFEGVATWAADGPLYWCPRREVFASDGGGVVWDRNGLAVAGPAERHLTGVGVLVAGDRITIFPHNATRGTTAPTGLPAPDPNICPAGERVG